MNRIFLARIAVFGVLLSLFAATAHGQLVIEGSDGSDGAFEPTEDVVIDLSLARTGAWDSSSSGAEVGRGVYDPGKWAVIFKYSSVTVPAGVTVRFANHPANPPVVWLVDGSVDVAGTVSVSAPRPTDGSRLGEAGPGGFRGGDAVFSALSQGSGFGPGAGISNAGGSYGTAGAAASEDAPYGNAKILPLTGGSGGSGGDSVGRVGGGGGGAILIAASDVVSVNGSVVARGARGQTTGADSGSGGAIRIVSNRLIGSGLLDADGGEDSTAGCCGASRLGYMGGMGRIRLEANEVGASVVRVPEVTALTPASPPQIWPPSNSPTARVVSIDGKGISADPSRSFELGAEEVNLPHSELAQFVVETKNVDPNGNVKLKVTPRHGVSSSVLATHDSGNASLSTWVAEVEMPDGFFAVQVRARNPVQAQ